VHRPAKERGQGIRFFLVLAAVLLLPHCGGIRGTGVYSTVPEPGDFGPEMERLEERAGSDPDPAKRAAAHRRLAALLSSAKNPSPDYLRALAELESAVALDPEGSGTDALRDQRALLTDIDRLTRERNDMRRRVEELTRKNAETEALREEAAAENRRLGTENIDLRAAMEQEAKERRELKATVERLSKENTELRNIVDQLKDLDIQLEEKRRSLR
jgi:chromosome segregation ATPase